jgi:hypothetical protein
MTNIDINSILLIGLNILVVGLFVYLSWVALNSYKKAERMSAAELDEQVYKKALALMDQSRQRAFAIVKESHVKAEDVIKDAEFLSEDSRVYLKNKLDEVSAAQRKKLNKISTDLLTNYTDELSEEKEKGIEALKQLSQGFRQAAVSELEEFKDILHKETVAAEKSVEQKISADYEILRKELTEYREDKLKKIDDNINKLLNQVAEEVIEGSVDLEKHQRLVMAALERAKKENLFEKG